MTDDQHGEGTPRAGSRWDPLPQGEYDDGATAFVELPEGGVDALLAADSPLAAPGHGYVPPQITVTPATTAGTDPAATGAWPVPGAPVDGAQWHDPHAAHQQQGHETGELGEHGEYGEYGEQPYGSPDAPYGTPYGSGAGAGQHGGDDRFTPYDPGVTGQWNFEEPAAAQTAPGHDVTGQWSIPVAGGDLPDESGEFTTSSLVEQWGGTPPATLPGGAPAPWATEAAGRPWGQQDPQDPAGQDQAGAYPQSGDPGQGYEPAQGHATEQGQGHGAGPGHGFPPEQGRGQGHGEEDGHGRPQDTGPASGYAPDPGTPGAHAPERAPAGPLPHETDPGHAAHLPHRAGPVEHEAPGQAAEPPTTGHAPEQSGFAAPGAQSPGFTDAAPDPSGYPGHTQAPSAYTGHEASAFQGHAPERAREGGHEPGRSGMPGHGPEQGVPGHGAEQHGLPGRGAGQAGVPGHTSDASGPGQPAAPEPAQGYAEYGTEAPEGPASAPEGEGEPVEAPQAAQEASQAPGGGGEPDAPSQDGEDAPETAEGVEGAGAPAAGPLPAHADAEAGPQAADASPADAPPADPSSAEAEPADGETPGDVASAGPASGDAAPGAAAPEDAAPEDAASGAPDDDPSAPHAAGTPEDRAATPAAPQEEHPLASYVLRVNGTERPVGDAWIGESLLYVLRERLGLAGAKDGCSQGECGACNVQVDGRLVASCLVPAVTAAGSEVRTVEGLAEDGRPSDVQRALARCGAVQCGFCIPGMAMTVHDLLEGNPAPTELETRQALCGNLCRCSGYRGVVDAVKEVVAEREAYAAPGDGDGDEPRIPHQAGPGAGGVNTSAFGAPPEPRAPEPHSPEPHSPEPHDQPYGQDGGQA
ncbi:2Fe-2S iron-sulfur cluster-binding protein [Streptomyces sp. NPDC003877]